MNIKQFVFDMPKLQRIKEWWHVRYGVVCHGTVVLRVSNAALQ